MRYKYIILTYIVIISFFMPAYIVSGSQTNTDENNPIDPGLYFITGSYGPLGDIDKTRHYINSDDYSIVTPLIPINYPYQNNPSSFIWDISKDSEGYYEIAPLDRNEYKVSFKYPYLEYGGRGVAVLGKDNESDAQKWIIKSTGLDWEGDLGPQFTISPKSYPEYKLLIENIRDSGLPANSTTNPLVAIPKHVYMGDSGSRWAFRNINTVLSSSSEISMSVQNSDLGVLLSLSSSDGSAIYYTKNGTNPMLSDWRVKYTWPILFPYNDNSSKFFTLQASSESENTSNTLIKSNFDDYILNSHFSIGNNKKNNPKTEMILHAYKKNYIEISFNRKGELGDSIEKTTDVMPFIDKKSLTPMLPIRILAEAAHATVVWDDEAKICILITAQGDIFKIANNEQANTDFKGDIVRDRLFVTSAVIEEIFTTKISWNKNLNEISLTL